MKQTIMAYEIVLQEYARYSMAISAAVELALDQLNELEESEKNESIEAAIGILNELSYGHWHEFMSVDDEDDKKAVKREARSIFADAAAIIGAEYNPSEE